MNYRVVEQRIIERLIEHDAIDEAKAFYDFETSDLRLGFKVKDQDLILLLAYMGNGYQTDKPKRFKTLSTVEKILKKLAPGLAERKTLSVDFA